MVNPAKKLKNLMMKGEACGSKKNKVFHELVILGLKFR